MNFLAASNDVVLDDIGFFGEPYDGTSAVSANTAAALNNPGWPIRAYVTAVGNDADEHYYGAYADSGVDGTSISGITTPGHLHLFQRTADTTDVLGLGAQPFNVISLPQNGEAAIFLTWNDPFGASANNYDLYLVQQSTGRVVASSTDVQSGRQDPSEVIDYVNRGAADRFPDRRAERARRGAAEEPEPLLAAAGMRRRRTGAARAGARAPQLQHGVAQRLGAGRRRRLAGERHLGRRDLLGVGVRRRRLSVRRVVPRHVERDRGVLQQPRSDARRAPQAGRRRDRRRRRSPAPGRFRRRSSARRRPRRTSAGSPRCCCRALRAC